MYEQVKIVKYCLVLAAVLLMLFSFDTWSQSRTNPGLIKRIDNHGIRGEAFETISMAVGKRSVCQEQCLENPFCKAYSWRKNRANRGPECKLYHNYWETVPTQYFHAGLRRELNKTFVGSREKDVQMRGEVYKSQAMPESGTKLCRDACAEDDSCMAYTYFKPGTRAPSSPATCEFMSSVTERLINRPCCVSGAHIDTHITYKTYLRKKIGMSIVSQSQQVTDYSACVHLCVADETCKLGRYRKTTANDPLGQCELSSVSGITSVTDDTGYRSFEKQSASAEMYAIQNNSAASGAHIRTVFIDAKAQDAAGLCWAACGVDRLCQAANFRSAAHTGASARCDLAADFDAPRKVLPGYVSGYKIPDSKPPSLPKPGSVPTRLQFSENSRYNVIEGDRYPYDMPDVRFPENWQGCSQDDKTQLRRAWVRAHYNVWRATQVLNHLNGQTRRRAEMWAWSFNDRMGSDPEYNNISPRGYFGSYDNKRFHMVRRTMNKLFNERFRGKTFKLKCRLRRSDGAHPCNTFSNVNANHYIYGYINICDNWFDEDARTDRGTFNNQATILTHELLHWMKIPKSIYWVTDRHDYWKSCLKYRGVKARYDDAAVWLGMNRGCRDWNHNRAVRVNDTYSWFATMLGDRIYRGILPQYPAENF